METAAGPPDGTAPRRPSTRALDDLDCEEASPLAASKALEQLRKRRTPRAARTCEAPLGPGAFAAGLITGFA